MGEKKSLWFDFACNSADLLHTHKSYITQINMSQINSYHGFHGYHVGPLGLSSFLKCVSALKVIFGHYATVWSGTFSLS